MSLFTRRRFLQSLAATPPALTLLAGGLQAKDATEPLPVAGIVTVYQPNTHADVILGKILQGFRQDGGPGPALKLVSLYTDQTPQNDLSRDLAKQHGFKIAPTIDKALTGGGDRLQVAGVLSIAEHGDYPYTPDTHQHLYPRRRFIDEIAATFRRCDQTVPVFSDKHLAPQWDDAWHVYQTMKKLEVPFMAGSSVPVAWRRPATAEVPLGCEIEAAIAVGYGGAESYGFHAIEMLQCLLERRRGGEAGVVQVEAVTGDAMWEAEAQGRWSVDLLEAALAAMPQPKKPPTKPLKERLSPKAACYLIDYRDGLKAGVAMAAGVARQFGVALKLKGRAEPLAIWFELEEEKPYGHFAFLLQAIDKMIHSGKPSYPVERTLLTTGVLDAAMHSLAEGKVITTDHLDIRYEPVDWPYANQPNR